MKKALNAWTVDAAVGFEEMFRQVKEAGFDGIELNVDSTGHSSHSLTLETTDKELMEIAGFSERYSLPVVSISTSMLWKYSMGATDEPEREMSKNVIRMQLKAAKTLGAGGILIVPGGITQNKSIAKAYEISLKTLVELKPEIEAAKINVGVENVWNGFFMSAYDMMVLIDHADCPYVGAYYDPGNVTSFSWPEYWPEILGERIKNVHVKDFKRGSDAFGGLNSGGEFVQLLKGDVNWEAVIPALRGAGFDGYLTAEVFKDDPEQNYVDYYKEVAGAIDTILKYAK